jgi:hypothetical protein
VISEGDREELERRLIAALKSNHEELKRVLEGTSNEWGYEDPIYRFYHHSFKVYSLQASTLGIVRALQDLLPEMPLNLMFQEIIASGTGMKFTPAANQAWLATTRPIVEAFFHARYFLEMAVRYGVEIAEPPAPLPSGWAALLYLFNLR